MLGDINTALDLQFTAELLVTDTLDSKPNAMTYQLHDVGDYLYVQRWPIENINMSTYIISGHHYNMARSIWY